MRAAFFYAKDCAGFSPRMPGLLHCVRPLGATIFCFVSKDETV